MVRTLALAHGELWPATASSRKICTRHQVLPDGTCQVILPEPTMQDFLEYLLRSLNHDYKCCSRSGFDDPVFDAFTARIGGDKHVPLFAELSRHEVFIAEQLRVRRATGELSSVSDELFYIGFWRAFCDEDTFGAVTGSMLWKGAATDFTFTSPLVPLLKARVDSGRRLYTCSHRQIWVDPTLAPKSKVGLWLYRVCAFQRVMQEVVGPALRDAESPACMAHRIQLHPGFGPTHCKQLMAATACIFPDQLDLSDFCPVGVGAAAPLEMLGYGGRLSDLQEAFATALVQTPLGRAFGHGRRCLAAAMGWIPRRDDAVGMLQVQLCEFRQFRERTLGRSPAFVMHIAKICKMCVCDATASRSSSVSGSVGTVALADPLPHRVAQHRGLKRALPKPVGTQARVSFEGRPRWRLGVLRRRVGLPRCSLAVRNLVCVVAEVERFRRCSVNTCSRSTLVKELLWQFRFANRRAESPAAAGIERICGVVVAEHACTQTLEERLVLFSASVRQFLVLDRAKADGNCLFRSVLQLLGLPGGEVDDLHWILRRCLVEFVSANREMYAPFFDDGESLDGWTEDMADADRPAGPRYGDAICLQGLCDMFGTSCIVWRKCPEALYQVTVPQFNHVHGLHPPWYLVYDDRKRLEEHFDALVWDTNNATRHVLAVSDLDRLQHLSPSGMVASGLLFHASRLPNASDLAGMSSSSLRCAVRRRAERQSSSADMALPAAM